MQVRYVHNTAGEYVAFVTDGHLFTPGCGWLGVVRREEVFNPSGLLVGTLRPDDRLARDRSVRFARCDLPPAAPMRPPRPLPAKRGLFLPALPHPLEDVFLRLRRPLSALFPLVELDRLHELEGCSVEAADGAFLGRISKDASDAGSLAAVDGLCGSPRAARSIFNPGGFYGSAESPLSPFHPTSQTPPRVERGGETVAPLTLNPEHADRVDPNALISWLAMG